MTRKCIVIIPALNEEITVGKVIDKVPDTLFDGELQLEVVVVNDGSTDNTANIAAEHGAYVISHSSPMGVGASFSDGVKEALRRQADYAVNLDADGQMDPADIQHLLKPIISGEADMVTASRFKDSSLYPDMPAIKRWGNDKVAKIVSRIVGRRYYDVSCGFRAYNREALLRLNLRGRFTYTQETFINLANSGHIRIAEVPVAIRGEREFGKSRVASNVFKYAYKSGSIILSAFKDYQPVRFFGSISLISFLIGLAFAVIFFAHYFITGVFRGYLFAGLIGAFMILIALIFCVVMVISDTLGRILKNEEEILYLNKKSLYYPSEPKDNTPGEKH